MSSLANNKTSSPSARSLLAAAAFFVALAATVVLGATLPACGGPSAVAVCQAGCDKTTACLGGTQGNDLDCKNMNCTQDKQDSAYSGCTNTNDILNCLDACYQPATSCNTLLTCTLGCPKCVK